MEVTAEQFEKFLDVYGRKKLTADTTFICDPPRTRYCDFTAGKVFPEAVVAQVVNEDEGPNQYIVMDEFKDLVPKES